MRADEIVQPAGDRKTAAEKKAEILALPPGSPRPNHRKHPLGPALSNYTAQNGAAYDPAFDAAVRSRFPHWFSAQKSIPNPEADKAMILALPPETPRPVRNEHPLGSAVSAYTNPEGFSYDPDFDTAVRARFPHWFETEADRRKAKILALPRQTRRPSPSSETGEYFYRYAMQHSLAYDPAFDAAVRERFPHWFDDAANEYLPGPEKKAMILAMPQGSPRLRPGHPLAMPLGMYTSRTHTAYDPDFDKAVRDRFPHWFSTPAPDYEIPAVPNSVIPRRRTAQQKKDDILAMPPGSPRPVKPDERANALYAFTMPSHGSYDPEFHTAVKARFPHWFRR
jgi:hypothetical protein